MASPCSNAAVAGAGTGRTPWAIFAVPPPTLSGEQANLLDAECVEADAGADDVDDGVDGADFVEMNFFERYVVDVCFGFAKFLKNGGGALSDRAAS